MNEEAGWAVFGFIIGLILGMVFINLTCFVSVGVPNNLVEHGDSFYEVRMIDQVEFLKLKIIKVEKELK